MSSVRDVIPGLCQQISDERCVMPSHEECVIMIKALLVHA